MAKFCKDIICGKKYFFITLQNELVCRTENLTEVLMPYCSDFDAAEKDECIHIAAADNWGNLIYIINNKGHWGRGIAAGGVNPENIFIYCGQDNVLVYYVNNSGLYQIYLDGDVSGPVLVDEILYCPMPFVYENRVYYINKNKKLCVNKEEIGEGSEISHISATNEYLCIKDAGRLDLINTEGFFDKKSLTRRHSGSAQCPLYVCAGEGETLCWQDKNEVFFSRKVDEKWCALETFTPKNSERLGIYKFDGKYDLGCLKNGKVCSLNLKN